jgi:hypothetical protein
LCSRATSEHIELLKDVADRAAVALEDAPPPDWFQSTLPHPDAVKQWSMLATIPLLAPRPRFLTWKEEDGTCRKKATTEKVRRLAYSKAHDVSVFYSDEQEELTTLDKCPGQRSTKERIQRPEKKVSLVSGFVASGTCNIVLKIHMINQSLLARPRCGPPSHFLGIRVPTARTKTCTSVA